MKKERLEKALDGLVGDVVTRLDELGDEGVTNPFESIVSIVFRKFISFVVLTPYSFYLFFCRT